MKRLVSAVLLLLFLLSAVPSSFAADANTYELPELNMKITVPDGWTTLTRDVKEDDPGLKALGIDKQALVDNFKKNNGYLETSDTVAKGDIVIMMTENDKSRGVYNLKDYYTDSEMESEAKAYENNLASMSGMKITNLNISTYKNKQANFVVMLGLVEVNGVSMIMKQYMTIVNGQQITVGLRLLSNDNADDMYYKLQKMVDSITFTKITSRPTNILAVIITVIVIAAVVVLIVLIVRRNKRKKNEAARLNRKALDSMIKGIENNQGLQ